MRMSQTTFGASPKLRCCWVLPGVRNHKVCDLSGFSKSVADCDCDILSMVEQAAENKHRGQA